jgi:hypothetical protein
MASLKSRPDDLKRQQNLIALWDYGCYVPLLVPFTCFLGSLYISPTMISDSGAGFLALRSMLDGGAFNRFTAPDPANIANDVATFMTWWSPGQYLVPGIFIWFGTSYGIAISLTTIIATFIGVVGWIQVARSFAVSSFVLFVFALGLNTFPYVTEHFLRYWGGELLLFAIAPWSLYAMLWSTNKPPIICLTISLLSAALLFFAKLTGLVVFATNVGAISLITLVNQRRLDSSIIAMWVASAIAAACLVIFWVGRDPVAAGVLRTMPFSWFPILFSVAGAVFSGIYGVNLFVGHPWMQINVLWATALLGPLGLLLMAWVWHRLRHTCYRNMTVLLLTIISMYSIATSIILYFWGVISFEDRHFRYAGILFFLLLLMAINQWRAPLAKGLVLAVVILLGLYGLRNYATSADAQMRASYYDPITGISQEMSPAILEYMRSEVMRHNFQRPVAAIPQPAAAISLPRFRIILIGWDRQPLKWAGRAEKIFVVVPEEMLLNNEAEVILRSFTDYDFDKWSGMKLRGMIIYTQ